MRRPNRTDEFHATEGGGRWRTPLPVECQAHIPWILCNDHQLITPFTGRGQRRLLNYSEQAQISEMQAHVTRLRGEGRLPSAKALWIYPANDRPPAPIAIQSDRWLRQKQAHFVSVRATQ